MIPYVCGWCKAPTWRRVRTFGGAMEVRLCKACLRMVQELSAAAIQVFGETAVQS